MKSQAEPSAAPPFEESKAEACEPYRHEPTARTVAFRQAGVGGETYLFGATRVFVASEKAAPEATQPTKK